MSEKLCPAGCGHEYDHYRTGGSCCPWVDAWCRAANLGATNEKRCAFADEHWRDFWTPRAGDVVLRSHEYILCRITAVNGARVEAEFCGQPEVCGYAGDKSGIRPATPSEIRDAELLEKDARIDAKNKKLYQQNDERRKCNIADVLGLLPDIEVAAAYRLADSLKMEVGAKYLARDGRIATIVRSTGNGPGSIHNAKHQNFSREISHGHTGCAQDYQSERDLLCRVYERDGEYFVETGVERMPNVEEWVAVAGRPLQHGTGPYISYACPILQKVKIGKAAGPASATPEARHDPAPRPAEIKLDAGSSGVGVGGPVELTPPSPWLRRGNRFNLNDKAYVMVTDTRAAEIETLSNEKYNVPFGAYIEIRGKTFQSDGSKLYEVPFCPVEQQKERGCLVGVCVGDWLRTKKGHLVKAEHVYYAAAFYIGFATPEEIEARKKASPEKCPACGKLWDIQDERDGPRCAHDKNCAYWLAYLDARHGNIPNRECYKTCKEYADTNWEKYKEKAAAAGGKAESLPMPHAEHVRAKIGKDSNLALAAQPAPTILPTWKNGDIQAYLHLLAWRFGSETSAARVLLDAHRKEGEPKATDREVVAYMRAELLRQYDTDDVRKCADAQWRQCVEKSKKIFASSPNAARRPST